MGAGGEGLGSGGSGGLVTCWHPSTAGTTATGQGDGFATGGATGSGAGVIMCAPAASRNACSLGVRAPAG
jgi:hypothetical protein